ncbi:MAG: FprA family A-type flavoprotein, partial [Firmicutes bacterium]|nr:FprA family A-type flavoprotein [Bacillota bacterium]
MNNTAVSKDILYIGANDHDIDLFEGHFDVPLGMAYNSYVINDEKVAVMDTIDQSKTEEWLGNVEAKAAKAPDYLIVQHMEPDH